ncbi:MAG: endonuclease/exonuclease/phosphatase family protein [Actinomycetia bacterium]|nr:endonuclease/exonuclease/phosphatase family protein [Actinomycetes bacterium]
MKVVSWNIKFALQFREAARKLATNENLSGADLVMLQEMDQPAADHIAERLGMHVHFHAAARHPQTGRPFGNAILSTGPLRETGHLPLPHQAPVAGQSRSGTYALADIGGVAVLAYSVHLETPALRLNRRVEQLNVVAEHARAVAGPVIVAGDFNTVSRRSHHAFSAAVAAAGMSPATTLDQPTLVRFGRSLRLDHIIARGWCPTASGVEDPGTTSDHAPIWCILTPSPEGPRDRSRDVGYV